MPNTVGRKGLKTEPGQRFGRLTAICRGPSARSGDVRWWCECDCGRACVLSANSALHSSNTKSCGCLLGEAGRLKFQTHGRSKTPEYKAWLKLRERCNNPSDISYLRYGGRGIRVCESWASSFENFLADMGPRPSAEHSIDRLDADGNYEPSNCAWSDRTQQARNKRVSLFITHNGETLHAKEWAERTGLSYYTLRNRILKLKWSPQQALETPDCSYHKGLGISYQGKALSLSAIARQEGVSVGSLHYHAIKKGIPIEDALKILKSPAKAKPAN